jgi:hypothetical protein
VDLEEANVSLVASTSEMALRDTINALFIFDLMARTHLLGAVFQRTLGRAFWPRKRILTY